MHKAYLRSTCCSRCFFCYTLFYVHQGEVTLYPWGLKKKKLTYADMLELFPSQNTLSNLTKIEKQWNLELKKRPKNPSVGRTIFKAYISTFLLIALLGFFSESFTGLAFYLSSFMI